MYQRDYFLKLAQQFAKMLSKVMGLKEHGELEKATQTIDEAYKELFRLDRSVLIELTDEQLIHELETENKLSYEQMEVLAKLMYEDGELREASRNNLYGKSLFILEYLNGQQKMYSFEREALIHKLKKQLEG